MKIIIFSPTSTKININSINERALGGADQALIQMVLSLSAKHEVWLYGNCDKNFGFHSSDNERNFIYFRNWNDLFLSANECDLLIHYRKVWAIPPMLMFRRAIFYSQDLAETPCFSGVQSHKDGNKIFDIYEKFIVLSEFHKSNIIDAFQIPEEKIVVFGNYASEIPKEHCSKKPLSFIYASTPYRGLNILNRLWDSILAEYPDATLDVFSSMAIYDDKTADMFEFASLYDSLKKKKGIVYHGSVPKVEMLKHMAKASILLYPNIYPETFCNVVMEARSCRTPIITSNLGALPETIGRAGFLIDGDPYSKEYQKRFLASIRLLVEQKDLYSKVQSYCYPIRTLIEWKEELLKIVEQKPIQSS